jgi:hypothetical protein
MNTTVAFLPLTEDPIVLQTSRSCSSSLPHPPNTLGQLKAAVLRVWDELPIEDVNKHVNKMPDQVEAVWAANGGHTRF